MILLREKEFQQYVRPCVNEHPQELNEWRTSNYRPPVGHGFTSGAEKLNVILAVGWDGLMMEGC